MFTRYILQAPHKLTYANCTDNNVSDSSKGLSWLNVSEDTGGAKLAIALINPSVWFIKLAADKDSDE